MENIGCVVYTETSSGIKAEWVLSNNGKIDSGTGIGIRLNPTNETKEFVGEYMVTYSDINGLESAKLKLNISFESGCYKLIWMHNGEITDIGIGIINNNKLSAGWFKINKKNK